MIIASWPEAGKTDGRAEADFERVQEIIRAIRNARSEYNVPPGRRIGAVINAGEHLPLIEREQAVIASLATLDLAHVQLGQNPGDSCRSPCSSWPAA